MIVCLCEGLNEAAVQRAMDNGAATVRAVARRTGAGTHCGGCLCDVRRMIEAARERVEHTEELPLAAK